MPRTLLAVVLCLASCVACAEAQEQSCQHRIVPVSFRDQQNLPIEGVSAADLEGKVRGKVVQIASLAPDPRPHRFVLAMDTSGSMGSIANESPLWRVEPALAMHFFQANREKSQVALLIFGREVTNIIGFAEGNAAVALRLQQIREDARYLKNSIKGTTALRDAILRGMSLLEKPSSADAIYVLTDGGDNASFASVAELKRRFAVTSVRLFAVIMQRDRGDRLSPPEEITGPQELAETARESGGEVLTMLNWRRGSVGLSADPEGKLKTEDVLARLYQVIVQDDLLTIDLPRPIEKNTRWELTISKKARQQLKGMHITYPAMLPACGSEVSDSRF